MNKLLTFEEYQEWGGEVSDEVGYDMLYLKAYKLIARHSRYMEDEEVLELMEDNVKLALFDIIELVRKHSDIMAESNANLKSENNDGYSVTFNDTEGLLVSHQKQFKAILDNYLLEPFNMLYGGGYY